MENEKPEEEVWVSSTVSSELRRSSAKEEYDEAVKTLQEVATKLAPGGQLSINLSIKNEQWLPLDRLASNIIYAKRTYNERAIVSNPEITIELGSLLVKAQEFNSIVEKRKKQNKRNYINREKERKVREKKLEESKGDENERD